PYANSTGHRVEVVFRDHVPVTEIGVSGGAVLVEKQRLRARLEIDDAVVFAVSTVDVLLDDQVPPAPVDLPFGVFALGAHECQKFRPAIANPTAAKFFIRAAIFDGR